MTKELNEILDKEFNRYQEVLEKMREKGIISNLDYGYLLSEQVGFIKCMALVYKFLKGEK